jgi:hypothetical protein
MEKIDYKKVLKDLYMPPAKEITVVDVPEMNFLMIDGKGDPNISQEYKEAIEALYALSYTLKFMCKKGKKQIDYGVLPLEGLWWVPNMKDFSVECKNEWLWTAMIMQPDIIDQSFVDEAWEVVQKKKNPVAMEKVRFNLFNEGKCAQILYRGPYKDEGPTIAQIHEFIKQSGCRLGGKHHEIYLSDPRKTAPAKLKTVIRQPMVK